MNSLGIALICSALQATLLGLLAAVLYWLASRRGSILAARVTTLSLGVLIVLTLAALCPLPTWWSWEMLLGRRTPASPPTAEITDARTVLGAEAPTVPEPSGTRQARERHGIGFSMARLRDVWDSLSRHDVEGDVADHRWPTVLPILFLAGAGLGLLRLVIGLLSVSRYRRCSRAIEDAALHEMLSGLQVTINCYQTVEIRESSDISTPATVGWQQPLILLPVDWHTWAEEERRAVLAHELAHIRRADYAAGLLARFSLLVHFYHPLVHWLVGRLQIQQELAADALAASCVGGRGPYLRALAQLLLRQDDRPPRWPARAFLSPSGTLLRRIGMLRGKDYSGRRTRSRCAAALLFVVLTGGAVAISALRVSAQPPEDTLIEVKEDNTGSLIFGVGVNSNTGLIGSVALNERNYDTAAASADHSRRVPFDLTYVPSDIVGVAAIRPAEFFRQPATAVFVDPMNAAVAELMKEIGLSGDPILSLEAIEQVIGEVKLTHNEKAPKGQQNQLILSPNLIRMEKDFDWKQRMRTVAEAEEIHYRGKTYYKGKSKIRALGLNICYFIPDARTLVLQSETTIRRVLDGQLGGSALAASAGWRHVEQGLIAVVMDVRRAAKITKEEEPDLAPVVENAANIAFAVDLHDTLTLCACASCVDNKAAETLVRWAKSQIADGIAFLDKKRRDKEALMPLGDRVSRDLLQHTQVEQDGSEATLRTQAAIDFAELGKMLLPSK